MVNSVLKGYQFIQLILSYLPAWVQAFVFLVFACFIVSAVIGVIKFLIGG